MKATFCLDGLITAPALKSRRPDTSVESKSPEPLRSFFGSQASGTMGGGKACMAQAVSANLRAIGS